MCCMYANGIREETVGPLGINTYQPCLLAANIITVIPIEMFLKYWFNTFPQADQFIWSKNFSFSCRGGQLTNQNHLLNILSNTIKLQIVNIQQMFDTTFTIVIVYITFRIIFCCILSWMFFFFMYFYGHLPRQFSSKEKYTLNGK